MRRMNIGIIVGHRSVFPGELALEGRVRVLRALERLNINLIMPDGGETRFGGVASYAEAQKYASFLASKRADLDGIIISLPNFGDESSIASAVRLAALNLPVFVHAFPDKLGGFSIDLRRDAFCGKFSLCNNLRQYGVKYTIGDSHVVDPDSEQFGREISRFLAVCRVVKGLRNARIGCIGARTPDFRTVRFSEKLLEASGMSTITVDLSDMVTAVGKLKDSDAEVCQRQKELVDYCFTGSAVTPEIIGRIARFSVVVERWITENQLNAYAIQCWPSMQASLGIFPCTFMSLMSNNLLPSACETDVMGAVSMYALQLASQTPAGLFDLNNNYGDDEERMVLFHCSNCPVSLMKSAKAGYNAMAVDAETGTASAFSTLHGSLKPGAYTFARVMTDDIAGHIEAYLGEGEMIDETIETFGTVGVLRVPGLPRLLNHLCRHGFEHHVAISQGIYSDALLEAFDNYLGWEVYRHR